MQTVPRSNGAKKKPGAGLIAGIAAGAVIVLAVVVLLIARPWESGGGGGGRKSVAGGNVAVRAVEVFFTWDRDAFPDLLPDEYYEAAVPESGLTVPELRERAKVFIDLLREDGGISYDPEELQVKAAAKKGEAYDKEKRDGIVAEYDDKINTTVTDAKLVFVDVTATYDGEKFTFEDLEVPLVKVSGKWYLDISHIQDFVMGLEDPLLEIG